jgi:hypothetical protein
MYRECPWKAGREAYLKIAQFLPQGLIVTVVISKGGGMIAIIGDQDRHDHSLEYFIQRSIAIEKPLKFVIPWSVARYFSTQ